MAISKHHIYRLPGIELTDSLLWRYMDFPKYVSLLLDRSLFFCQVAKLDDPYEGMLTRQDYAKIKAKIKELYYSQDDSTKVSESDIGEWMDKVRRRSFVNCWHLGSEESAAMWSLYGLKNQSIAITATFSTMVAELPHSVAVGPVDYCDFDTTSYYFMQNRGQDGLVLWKRTSFRHEREVRFLISDTTKALAGLTALPPHLVGRHGGYSVLVNLERIIAAVYVDPTAPLWFYEMVEEISKRHGLDNVVRKSGLLLRPDYS